LSQAIPSIPEVRHGNWNSAIDANKVTSRAIKKLSSFLLGPNSVPTFGSVTLNNLTASRLVSVDSNKTAESVDDLTVWIGGTANQVNVTDDSDGTVTLSTPQDIDTAADPTFATLKLLTGGPTSLFSPQTTANLSVYDSGSPVKFVLSSWGASATNTLYGYAQAGTEDSPSATTNGMVLLNVAGYGHTGSSYTSLSAARMRFRSGGNWGVGDTPAYVEILATPSGAGTASSRATFAGATTTLVSPVYIDSSVTGTDEFEVTGAMQLSGTATVGGLTTTGTIDASAGEVLVTDNDTSEPSAKSDGYVGVAIVGGQPRIYFAVDGDMYYVEGSASAVVMTGSPIGLLLTLTYNLE